MRETVLNVESPFSDSVICSPRFDSSYCRAYQATCEGQLDCFFFFGKDGPPDMRVNCAGDETTRSTTRLVQR